jgi:glycosyltransferase involved in cell wall biosynthesis
MKEPLIKRLRYKTFGILRRLANRVYPKSLETSKIFADIGISELGENAPRALVLYNITGIELFVRGKFDDKNPIFKTHTMYWESVELVKQLNKKGFVVDYADRRTIPRVDWGKYALIIDEADNLKNLPKTSGQKRIFYATGCHWLTHNKAELERIDWFHKRTGIFVPPNRQIPGILGDQHADYITYFGNDYQLKTFDTKALPIHLNISSVYEPKVEPKNIEIARKNFLWLGGGGLIHKGLDLVLEAFAKMPEYNLYIAGNLDNEPEFSKWAKTILEKHKNIHFVDWVDVSSQKFYEIAQKCVGVVYASCAEGGAGSVIQMLHFGLIPIISKTSAMDGDHLGEIVDGNNDREIIESIMSGVKKVSSMPEKELQEKSSNIIKFARENHTRVAYSRSIEKMLDIVLESKK